MKRSEIQDAICYAKRLIKKLGIHLPMYAEWSIDEWRKHASQISVIVQTMRGWDVTDFGSGNFSSIGATLFTLRNGIPGTDIGCPYAEKLIVMRETQTLPLHFHHTKTEDIINRGGGILVIQVYRSEEDGRVDSKNDVIIRMDGIEKTVCAGSKIEILPGCSMTIYPGLYHLFSVKQGEGDVVAGEVSTVNDDTLDNHFATSLPRFSCIEEDAPILVPLCNEYEHLLQA